MKKFAKYTLKGNTIIEVLIAMGILSFSSALAVLIYLNIQKSSLPFFKVKAIELAELNMQKAIANKEFSEETVAMEEFTVKRTMSSSNEFPDCFVLHVLVFDGTKKKIHELEQVIYKGNEKSF